MVVCLKGRALRMLDRATQMENIQIADGKRIAGNQCTPGPRRLYRFTFRIAGSDYILRPFVCRVNRLSRNRTKNIVAIMSTLPLSEGSAYRPF